MKVFRAARVKRDLTAHQDRLDEIVDQAAAQGWEPLLDQRGQHGGAGIRIPSATDMIREILGQEFEYRLLSSAAHGQLWAIRELAFAEMDPATDVAREHGFAAGFEKSLSILGIQWVATAVARALARGAWSLASYAHWDLGHLRGTFDTASNQLRLGIARDSHDPSAPNASS